MHIRLTRFGDIAPGRIGNGTLTYDVPLTDPSLAANAWKYDNLQVAGTTLAAKDAAKPGILEIRNPTSYVYLTGKVTLNATVGDGGRLAVVYSENNGLDWKDITTIDKTGEQTLGSGRDGCSASTTIGCAWYSRARAHHCRG